LVAAAKIAKSDKEIVAKKLRAEISDMTKRTIKQLELNNFTKVLIGKDEEHPKILKRLKKGVYGFIDPRMPSLILLKFSKFGS